jgi:hypothetical protein
MNTIEFSTARKIDEVLDFLNKELKPPIHTLQEISSYFKRIDCNIDETETILILDMLEKEGYVSHEDRNRKEYNQIGKEPSIREYRVYLITFKGRLLCEAGGWDSQKSRLDKMEYDAMKRDKRTVFLTWILACGTGVLALSEILKFFNIHPFGH